MQRWEYKTLQIPVFQSWGGSKGTLDVDDTDAFLNGHGADGWELVAATQTAHTAGTAAVFCIMKRPLPECSHTLNPE